MINFFRRIRKSLLSENKFSKYLIYAIGEIFLVVIGILIALQINNWNESRKLKNKTQGYIESLRSDLIRDTTNIDKHIAVGKSQLLEIEKFKSFSTQSTVSIEQKLDSSFNLNTLFYRYFPINQTFLDIQSSGNSALLTEDQRRALIELGYLQNRLVIANDKIIDIAIGEISERNKYITEGYDFYKSQGIEPDKNTLIKALLHQHNRLEEMEDLANVMERFGTMIKDKSKEALLLLEQL
ncbi:DUF6090 family protein [Winogradskyella sp.]|uniref:DUF6090 family protein n=1 Tax=Winogradskyella sp. TaxID=1883156 RepID=UPI001B045540|nr:DUF6090 family protein [Winogradskyella sp.]MBO6879518.1 hypothetical protein [Winogradskyella sp.]